MRSIIAVFVMAVLIVRTGFSVSSTYAASGIHQTINFQGKLVDNTGLNVANGNYDIVFSLYAASSGGSPLWTETWNSGTTQVVVQDGVFRVALGTHSTFNAFDFNNDSLYLAVKVGADAEMTPRIRFTSVPYAFVAKTVVDDALDFAQLQDTLDVDANLTVNQTGYTWSQTYTGTSAAGLSYTASGAVSSGNAAALDINVSNTSTSVPAMMLTNAGSGFALRINDDGTTTDSTPFVIDTGGNVGIGTTSPGAKLDIAAGNLNLDLTTNANQYGVISKNGVRFIHDFNYGNNGTVTTAGYNTFVGVNTGNLTMGSTATASYEASGNTAIGNFILSANTTGYNNTANGYFALFTNTTGNYNTASGTHVLYSNTTGYKNTADGYSALSFNTTGYQNTASGGYAGRYIADGVTGNTTGNNSLFLGHNTRALADGQTNQIVIGSDAIGIGSNSVVLGNNSITTTALRGNVGIGTTSPPNPLTVQYGSGTLQTDLNATTYTSSFSNANSGPYRALYAWGEVNPTGTSSVSMRTLEGNAIVTAGNTQTISGNITGLLFQSLYRGNSPGSLAIARGLAINAGKQDGSGTLAEVNGGYFNTGTYGTSTGTLTLAKGIYVTSAKAAGSTVVDNYGIFIDNLTTGTNNVGLTINEATGTKNINLLLGTTTIPSGGFSIYNSSADNNYFAGNVGIGTTNPSQKLHVAGNAYITGALYDSSNTAGSSGNILTSTGTGTSWGSVSSVMDGTYFKQGGNSFSALATLGTNDTYGLAFETNNVERMRIDTSGHVGIGTTSPTTVLQVAGTISPSVDDTYDLGTTALRFQDLYLGPATLHIGTSTSDEGLISYDTTNNIFNFGTDGTANGNIAFFTDSLFIDKATTFVGIGTTSPSYPLDVYVNSTDPPGAFTNRDGTCIVSISKSGLDCSSDERLKKDIQTINPIDNLSKILALRPVTYEWKQQTTDEKHFGVIAQELERVFPELVSTDKNGYKTVAYSAFAPLLISSIQQQQDLITSLQTQVQVPIADSNIASISSRLNTLDTKVTSWDSLFISIQSIIQSIQDTVVAIQNQLGLVQNDVIATKDQVASLSASLTSIVNWKEAMSSGGATLGQSTASAALGATDSAMLEKVATVSGLLVKDRLQVDGKATMFDLSVLNKLTAGTIVLGAGIDGDEINSSTGIRFQTLAQGPIDFMNGKVVINVDGSVEMTHLKLSTADPDKTTLGTATIRAGHTSMTINNSSITGDSMVFITPTSFVDTPIYVNGKIPGVGFVVTVAAPAPQDIQFQWMIVN